MRRLARVAPSTAALVLLALLTSSRVAVASSESSCVNGGQQNPDIADRKTALQRSPSQIGKRMELANLLEKAGCYDEAVHLLEEGQKYNPFSPALLFSLRRARNMAREEHVLEEINQAEASARLKRKTERCTRERDVAACDEILSQQPNDTKILIAKGDALVEAHRPAEASKAYIRASELAPHDTALTGKLQALRSQRRDAIAHKEPPTQVAAVSPVAAPKAEPQTVSNVTSAKAEPQTFSNVAEATRSN